MRLLLNRMNKNIVSFAGESSFTKEIKALIQTLAGNSSSVLLIGERGTGKRLIAMHIHYSAAKSFGYFFEVNCKSFNQNQILAAFEDVSKLMTYNQKITVFVNFLDLMPINEQKVFLQLIKNSLSKGINLRLISSVESSLEEKVHSGNFLSDLYYRLNAVVLNILPLRQRKEDIVPIAQNYLNDFSKKSGYEFTQFTDEAMSAMLNNFWVGNADELINSVQRAFIVGKPPLIRAEDLGLKSENKSLNAFEISGALEDKSLKSAVDTFKKEYVTRILEENGWNQTKTAGVLGIQRTYVIKLMNELNIRK